MFVLIVSDFFGMFWTWTAETKQLGTWNKKVHNGFKVQTQAKNVCAYIKKGASL